MDKSYEPSQIEAKWYAYWEAHSCFAPQKVAPDAPAYCILIPPPNVTGTLHMGHAFQHTLQDALIRYHRMRGDETLWQPGTDHAGIATQMVVERQLNAEGKKRTDFTREEFVAKVWEWKAYSGGTITQQMRRLGDSCDWSREAFTMDASMSAAVVESFEALYDQKLIYRGKRLVNWDPVLGTALSDLEVINSEEDGHLWHLVYPLSGGPLADGTSSLTVATTRPETLLGDAAVAVHPEDERYKNMVGRMLKLPLTDREIPVVADDFVDPAFGTGCVKITPAHDFNDNALGARHSLPLINVLNPDATMADTVPERFRGLDRFVCRKKVVAELEQLGLMGEIKPHKLMVPRGDRSNAVVEPYLTDQWYMSMAPLAAPALAAVKDGRIKFVPDNWSKTYFQWLENIQDWCISRQLWWGHRIPAWYDEQGNIYVAKDEAAARAKHGLSPTLPLRQDADVLDTWYSSALWPFGIMDWPRAGTPSADPRFQVDGMGFQERFLPSNVLVTGFDIIFFWVARMVMMTMHFKKDALGQPIVPFKEVYITGLIRDEHGQKMSKSKGNIIDPIDLIDGIGLEALVQKRTAGMMQPKQKEQIEKRTRKQFPDGIAPSGTDALRFTLAALAGPSRDINFDPGRLEGYRNFCTKLWNAARFALMNTEGQDCGSDSRAPRELSLADRWIQQRLAHAVAEFEQHIAAYRFDLATKALYDFTWYEFCDWYLELVKPTLNDPTASDAAKRGTRHTLITTLEQLLRALHPLMPFITEEIWQRVALVADVTRSGGEHSVMLQRWPTPARDAQSEFIEADMRWVMDCVSAIRKIRSEWNMPPLTVIGATFSLSNAIEQRRFLDHHRLIQALARIDATDLSHPIDGPGAMALVGETKIQVMLKGNIDKDTELARLDKLLARLEADVPRVEGKLANENYVRSAPSEVVAKDRERLTELANQIAEFKAQRAKIQAL